MGICGLLLIFWFISWLRDKKKAREKAVEDIIIKSFSYAPAPAHVNEPASFASRDEMQRRGCL
jgi:hypothetical protein